MPLGTVGTVSTALGERRGEDATSSVPETHSQGEARGDVGPSGHLWLFQPGAGSRLHGRGSTGGTEAARAHQPIPGKRVPAFAPGAMWRPHGVRPALPPRHVPPAAVAAAAQPSQCSEQPEEKLDAGEGPALGGRRLFISSEAVASARDPHSARPRLQGCGP